MTKKFIDKKHQDFFEEIKNKYKKERIALEKQKIRKRKCIKCNVDFFVDFEHTYQKKCPECHEKYPNKKRIKNKNFKQEFKVLKCLKCKKTTQAKKCASHIICDECKKKSYDELMLKQLKATCKFCNKEVVSTRNHRMQRLSNVVCEDCKKNTFLRHSKLNLVLKLLKETDLTRTEIKKLITLEKDYIREAAIYFFGEVWWEQRKKKIESNARQVAGKKRKVFFDNLRKDSKKLADYLSYLKRKPSSLETMFFLSLPQGFETEKNVWQTIKIDSKFEHREIDLKVKVDNKKFAIFIDGEAFHGENSVFKTTTPQLDARIAKAFANLGYYVIRYSETEIRKGWAINHFLSLFEKFKNKKPSYYYRNWQTNQEILDN